MNRLIETKLRRGGVVLLSAMLFLSGCSSGGGGEPSGQTPPPPQSPTPPGGGTTPITPTPAAWSSSPTQVNEGTDAVYETQIAYDSNGDGLAVWVARDTMNNTALMYSRYSSSGSAWSSPQTLYSSADQITAQTGPGNEYRTRRVALTIDSNNNAYVAWRVVSATDGHGSVMVSTLASGSTTWSSPATLNNDTAQDAVAISLASNGGVTVASWLEVDSQDSSVIPQDVYGVYASVASGSSWGTPDKLDDGTQAAYVPGVLSYYPPITLVDATGNATVVFNYATTGWTVWSASRPANGSWQTAVQIDGGNNRSHDDVFARHTPDGVLHAVWVDRGGLVDDVVMYSQLNANAGTWSAPMPVGSQDGEAHAPTIAGNASGEKIIAWIHVGNSTTTLKASHYETTSGLWGSAVDIKNGVNPSRQPEVAMDESGNAIVVWQWVNLWYSVYTAGDAWSTAASLTGGRHGMHYQFAAADSDTLAFIWAYNETGNDPAVNISLFE